MNVYKCGRVGDHDIYMKEPQGLTPHELKAQIQLVSSLLKRMDSAYKHNVRKINKPYPKHESRQEGEHI